MGIDSIVCGVNITHFLFIVRQGIRADVDKVMVVVAALGPDLTKQPVRLVVLSIKLSKTMDYSLIIPLGNT